MSDVVSRSALVNSCFEVNLDRLLATRVSPWAAYWDRDGRVYGEDFTTVQEAARFRQALASSAVPGLAVVNEASKGDLVAMADKARVSRSKSIKVFYRGVMNTRGWIHFQTPSQVLTGKYYSQYIRLDEGKSIKDFKEFDRRDIVRLFLFGKVSVHCTCPDYQYRFKYMGSNLGYGIYKESREPKIRNPQLQGSVCKHLVAVLEVLGLNWPKVARDMPKTKYWKRRYDP